MEIRNIRIFPNELDEIKQTLRSLASETFTAVSAPIQYAAIKAYTENFHRLSRRFKKNIKLYCKIYSR